MTFIYCFIWKCKYFFFKESEIGEKNPQHMEKYQIYSNIIYKLQFKL